MTETAHRSPSEPIQVGELTRYLKYLVEQDEFLAALSVRGEVSDLSRSPAGHVYFVLKDGSSQVSCVLFRREALAQRDAAEQMRKGVAVIAHGFLTVYEPRGTCQIYVERVVPQGEGALYRKFELLKARLDREGLFAMDRKRPLPPSPKKLALVTSPDSQAYHDVLHRLGTQYPFVTVVEVGVSVQGEGAADEMAMAIDIVNRLTDVDVILLVRGGGSPEDLASFNEERLARAVFSSRIPVVTGIGHETDYAIVDYVADYRAATPSLAAAAAVPDVAALVARAAQLHRTATAIVDRRLSQERGRWVRANRALVRCSPASRVRSQRQRADELARRGRQAVTMLLTVKRARLDALKAQLTALDPLAILNRGYAVLSDPATDRVVSTVGAAQPGSMVRARVSDGEFLLRVEES